MGLSLSRRGLAGNGAIVALLAASVAGLAPLLWGRSVSGQDVRSAIEKANLYIEVARGTERAVESWERYASWVNLKTGPTGKERYISYGMYEVYEISGMLNEARRVASLKSSVPRLDATMKRYMDVYEALVPILNTANAYYERKGYLADGMIEGKALHGQMVPLVKSFLQERETMLGELRPFVREVERRELEETEAREGRSTAWHAARVMHTASRVVDVFPRTRPTPMNFEAIEEELKAVGPDTPGEKLDEIIAGVVRPAGFSIDMDKFGAALKVYEEAVEAFDLFAKEKPEGLKGFKDTPRHFLNALRALHEPLLRSSGREFDGSDPLVGRVVQGYFEMLSASSSIARSQLRTLL